MEIFEKFKKELPKIQKDIPLSNHTTFRIGGPARFFFTAKTKDDLIRAIAAAQKNKTRFFILGSGSNLLVSDRGYNGLVIKIQNTKYKIQNTKLFSEAGVNLGDLVKLSLEKGLTGLEWAAGIPGTIGGAIRGNAGAFGKSISDTIKKVEVLEIKISRIRDFNHPNILKNVGMISSLSKIFQKKDCKFGYRNSIFKQNKNLIILSAEIQLRKGDKKAIQKKIKKHLDWRRKNQPLNFPSCGSVFKNPRKFSAGELIEKCGLKGKKINKAQISEKHANFIVNLGPPALTSSRRSQAGGAKAKDVVKLIQLIKKKVKAKFKIELKEEIQYLGF